MRTLVFSIVALTLGPALRAEAPIYSAESIVNAADNQPGTLSPNTIATIYGKSLAYGTHALVASDMVGGALPCVLPGTGAQVLIGNLRANLYYVSPTQINFLVPPNLLPGKVTLTVSVDALAGPAVSLQLLTTSPSLFQLDLENAIATRADGSLIEAAAPAKPGDIVILYATGLGQTTPPAVYAQIPTQAARLKQLSDFVVYLDGNAIDHAAVAYAGVAPGFAGLYQINLYLPDWTGTNPEIRIGITDSLSPPGLRLPVQP
jgi:uncharacterized protein (TIGR03437 family)